MADTTAMRAAIAANFPDLGAVEISRTHEGWDSIALELATGDIFKFPKSARALLALRREQSLLAAISPAVSLAVPRMRLFETPNPFTHHVKIPGEHLLTAAYAGLDETRRAALGDTLGRFYTELHALPVTRMQAAGALPVQPWLAAGDIAARALPLLPAADIEPARTIIDAYAALGPDPHGLIYGYFDGHGWNMAFDHEAKKLNGVYDFADSGIGPLHRDFLYSSMVDPDLMRRIADAYEGHSGRRLDRQRIHVLTGAHRLWELAEAAEKPDEIPDMLAGWRTFASRP